MMSEGVLVWWGLLCTVAAFNVAAWGLSAAALRQRKAAVPPEFYTARRLQLVLSGVYVLGCAYRSVFPVFDVPRQCLVDSWLSSVLVGRFVATCAELCFVAQWAFLLREAARETGSVLGQVAARSVVPLIVIAEICSWYSVITTANIGHTIEESLWGISVALLVAGVAVMGPRCARDRRPLLMIWCAAGAAYVAYMFLVDVPMYWTRWVADQAAGRHYLTIAQGLHDVSAHRVVSYRWGDWKSEMIWMSLYFSVAVWLSIALIHAPALRSESVEARRRTGRYVFSWTSAALK
ncbi:MAG TPA: hypothetical protein VHZ99_02765 [Steroidobacteraceae bacterium]|jgi:hypothetical membrane protein|nr:hypothetical protein [Steroidobacteraceae bacterium]